MTTMIRITLISVFIAVVLGQTHHGHGHEQNVVSPSHVTSETSTPSPDDILCPYFLSLDCETQTSETGYLVCGSDGVMYTSNCHFLQQSCVSTNLTAAHQGACHPNTTAIVTDVTNSTTTITGTTVLHPEHTSGSIPQSTTLKALTVGMSTVTPSTTVTMTTTESIGQIIQSVLCNHKDDITCDNKLDFQCGSNGQVYPNPCEFYKAVCADASLVLAEQSRCAVSGLPVG